MVFSWVTVTAPGAWPLAFLTHLRRVYMTSPFPLFFRSLYSRASVAASRIVSGGGKDRLTLKDELVTTRERWASLHNEHLERHGHTAKIDSRSNLDRGIHDERERHLGHVAIQVMTDEEKLALKAKRQKGKQAASS